MSLRGVGKALYRAPHQLFGQKTQDELVFKQWEHDIKVTLAGLEYLKSENGKWKLFWSKAMTNLILVIEVFRDLHCELGDIKSKNNGVETNVDKHEEFTDITIFELEQSVKLGKIIYDRVLNMSTESSDNFVSRCDEMIKALKNIEKLITKRNHKKIDYDMQSKRMESILNGSNATEKAQTKLEANQQKLTETEVISKDMDDKLKLIVPEALSNLSEFVNKLTLKLYYSNTNILDFIQRNLTKFTRIHGIVEDFSLLTYDQIMNEFNVLNSQAHNKLDNLTLLKDFRSLRDKTLAAKTTEQVNTVAGTVVDSTVNFTSTLYTKAAKPNQKLSVSFSSFKIDNPIKPYSKAGMFATALDPIDFITNTSCADELLHTDLQQRVPLSTGDEHPKNSDDERDDQIAEKEEIPPMTTSASTNDTNWMKPLKNSTLNKRLSSLEAESPMLDRSSDKMSINSLETTSNNLTANSKYIANGRVSSLHLDKNTDTYKYVEVSMDEITKTIYLAVSTPEITAAPVTASNGLLHSPDKNISDYIIARSSITTNAFKAYMNI